MKERDWNALTKRQQLLVKSYFQLCRAIAVLSPDETMADVVLLLENKLNRDVQKRLAEVSINPILYTDIAQQWYGESFDKKETNHA